ncbi:MAG TPA: ABC transporter substrate-binding protein [Acidimicrobiia bacterium]|nr:ABC transporter substrate-binding protein [Acidimicrobiia bacterium]
MRRVLPILVGATIVVAGCTTSLGSPHLPRPAPDTMPPTPTTTIAATTTTILIEAGEALGCTSGFCLVYNLSPHAAWSDGSPVSPGDLAHTATALAGAGMAGYDSIRAVEAVDPSTALVTFDDRYGAWRSLFDRVYREGPGPDEMATLETTGPFEFTEWQEGEYLVLERSDNWWADRDPLSGEPPGSVAEITFVFMSDLSEMVDALADGEIDVISARPDPEVVESLTTMEGVEFDLAPGPFWEHIDFHHDDPMLSRPWVRQAIALAIDRERILDETVRLIDPAAGTLDNTIWMSATPYYEPHFDIPFDPQAAERVLAENGCERGEDGVQVCDGTRMSFVWAATDDVARRATFEVARDGLETIGIELIANFVSPSEFVSREFLFGGPERWQIINFSWRARPEPLTANATYYCDDQGSLNVNRYCSDQVESLIRSTETIVDPDERASVYNEADRIYLEDLAIIPLYQKPVLLAWVEGIDGPAVNYTLSSDLWNVAAWRGRESIVIAVPSEPAVIDPRSTSDDQANLILGPLLYGVFGMDPAHEHIPVLVESIDVIEGED